MLEIPREIKTRKISQWTRENISSEFVRLLVFSFHCDNFHVTELGKGSAYEIPLDLMPQKNYTFATFKTLQIRAMWAKRRGSYLGFNIFGPRPLPALFGP